MPLSPSGKPGVLIVDDEPQVAAALADILEDSYQVITERSGEAALEALAGDKRISVILSDQRIPGMTGDELFARAKEISLATRILVTGYADIAAVIDAVNQGKIFAYVTKPWQRDDIVLTVGRAADYCELNHRIQYEQGLLHQLMDSSVDAIFFKDRAHRFIKVNAYTAKVLGAESVAAVEGHTAADFLPQERCAARRRLERRLFHTGEPVRDHLELVKTDRQERWLATNLAPLRDRHGGITGLVGITRDVTESKKLDQMKDQFISTVRHELRTPLTAIQGALDLLRSGAAGALAEAGLEMVEIALRSSNTLISLINDLLDTEAFETGTIRLRRLPLDVAELVTSAVSLAQELGRTNDVAVRAGTSLEDVAILGDRERLLQVLAKLIANAVAAAPEGSVVMCRAREAGSDRVRISVVDQGAGLASSLRDHVFKKFTQVDSSTTRRQGGAGLGLYIAKSIVEAHGGTIDFVSVEGRGTEFFFELPIHEPAAAGLADGTETR